MNKLVIAIVSALALASPAFAETSEATSGIPRAINILCDTALVYGFATGADRITTDLIGEVIDQKRSFGIFGR